LVEDAARFDYAELPTGDAQFAEAYGIEKSAISERFIQASREKLKTLMERPLSELRLCAIVNRRDTVQRSPDDRCDWRGS
jgi:hypothetical protein